MEVNDALIDKLCRLAALEFDAAGRDGIKKDLERMIGFVEKLNELDTTGVEPLRHMSDEFNVLREDVIEGSIDRAEALGNAPDADGRYFKVPKVIRNPQETARP